MDWIPRCEGGPLPPDFQIPVLFDDLLSAMDEAGLSMRVDPGRTKSNLAAAGFVDIREEVIRLPWNAWPNQPDEKEIGRWFNLAISKGLLSMVMAPLTRVKGRPAQHVRELVARVMQETGLTVVHGYCLL